MKKLSCYFFGLSLLLNHALLTVAAPIDNAAIADPDQQGDWRAYGRSYSERRFSPLRQIADDNVGQLKLDWYLDMPDSRALNATPLVVAGVMYFTASQSLVRALNATNGELLWCYLRWSTDRTGCRHG